MINKKQLFYNALSLLSVFLGFVFIIMLGNKFGASEQTDAYFLSIVIITYAGTVAESVWAAFKPYYIEEKIADKHKSDYLYSVLLNGVIIASLLILLIYFFIIRQFSLLPQNLLFYLDIFIFVFFIKNILIYHKILLDLEHFFSLNYIVDIIITVVNIIVLAYLDQNSSLRILAFSTLFAVILSVSYQLYIVYSVLQFKYSPVLYDKKFKQIYIGSIKLRLGLLFYNFKDIVIAMVFTAVGQGVYTLYSYASKFVGVIMQVVNAPVVNVFATKISYLAAHNELGEISRRTKRVIIILSSLYVLLSLALYILLPSILNLLFGNRFSLEQIDMIKDIFIYFAVINFLLTSSSVYIKVLDILKQFDYLLLINMMFFISLLIEYFIYINSGLEYKYFLFVLVVINVSIYILHRKKTIRILSRENHVDAV